MEISYLKNHPEFIPVIAAWSQGEWGFLYPARTIDDRIRALQKNLNTDRVPLTFVAVEHGKIAGTVGLEEHDMETRMEYSPWLVSLYVLPEFRRTGLARELVERATEKARSLGAQRLYLFTLKSHAEFYENLGWKIVEKTVYQNRPVTIMAINLEQAG